jgi:membrane protein
MRKVAKLVQEAVRGFIQDDSLSHGAAIAFFTVTSLGPILLLVVAVAGLVFGRDAARNAVAAQLTGLMGHDSAEVLQAALQSASNPSSGVIATIAGLVTLLVTTSGVFGEIQSSLNIIWKTRPRGGSISRLVRARTASLGLVIALGFLLNVSLAVSAAVSALNDIINRYISFGAIIITMVNMVTSYLLIAVLFAAIYKVLPDRRLEWRDVWIGSLVTAALFTGGKTIIGWYIGSSTVGSSYGAASALIVVLIWVYYSALIFLLGAELTRAYSIQHGSHQDLDNQGALAAEPVPALAGAKPTAKRKPARSKRRTQARV